VNPAAVISVDAVYAGCNIAEGYRKRGENTKRQTSRARKLSHGSAN